jgi:hypothetical protein
MGRAGVAETASDAPPPIWAGSRARIFEIRFGRRPLVACSVRRPGSEFLILDCTADLILDRNGARCMSPIPEPKQSKTLSNGIQ